MAGYAKSCTPPAEPRDWKAELKRIVEFLNYNAGDDDDSDNLWNVLSALRGPDVDDHMEALKLSTTSVIRHAIGLATSRLVIESDAPHKLSVRLMLDEHSRANGHFTWHAKQAFEALGLKWDENNGPEPGTGEDRRLRIRYIAAS